MMTEAENPGAPDPRGVESRIEELRNLVAIQGTDGNWNYDHYMRGMFNGMELALSVLEGREPQYRDAPEAAAEAHAKPVWTREVPTVEGWYWVRQRIGGPWVSYFSQADLEDRIRSPKNYLRLEFAGPLTPPAEPGEDA